MSDSGTNATLQAENLSCQTFTTFPMSMMLCFVHRLNRLKQRSILSGGCWRNKITKGSILELACGTCGHGILLAQGGFSVTGMDINPNMLEGAQRRMDTVGVKIKLIRGDMVDFDLEAMRFDCVIFMAGTFPIITTYEDIKSHFRSVKRHLKPGGLYIIDMDAQNKIRTSSETGIWGKKTVRLDNGYVEVWHEDFPGD